MKAGERRLLTAQQREEFLLIDRLQRLNCYEQIVRRLTNRESATSVARWGFGLKPEGPAQTWTFWYWRKHILALAKYVRAAKNNIRTRKPVPADPVKVLEEIQVIQEKLSVRDALPEGSKQVWKHVEHALNDLHAEQMIKLTWLKQLGRLELVEKWEKLTGIPLAFGHKEIDSLTKMAEALGKIEMGYKFLRGKDGVMPPPEPDYSPDILSSEKDSIAQGMRQFDEVDRNLLREATHLVLDMIQDMAVTLDADSSVQQRSE